MSDARPDPFVPVEVDLSGLDGFMLDVQRLFASELWALSTGEEFKAAVGLWGRAWQQSPPGSLPNDERILASFSGAARDWRKVREMALRGFVECSDGRLYHKVLCQDVMTAHRKRQAFRERTKNATEARRNRNDGRNDRDEKQRNDERDGQRNDFDDDDVTSVQGRRRRRRHLSSSLRSDDARAAFDRDFWPRYPNKVGKPAAEKAFAKLFGETAGDTTPILAGLERYIREKPIDRPWLNPTTFLNQRRFEDQPATGSATAIQPNTPRIDFGSGVTAPYGTIRSIWGRRQWLAHWGPAPDQPGCRIPAETMAEIMGEREAA